MVHGAGDGQGTGFVALGQNVHRTGGGRGDAIDDRRAHRHKEATLQHA